MQGYLTIEQVGKSFDTATGPFTPLCRMSRWPFKKAFVSIIGHSGCGKSTLLNIVAGLSGPAPALCCWTAKWWTSLGPRSGGGVPEPQPAAMAHGLRQCRGWRSDKVFGKSKTSAERDAWTKHNLELVHMSHALHKKPDELSAACASASASPARSPCSPRSCCWTSRSGAGCADPRPSAGHGDGNPSGDQEHRHHDHP
jgi:nitrate/nitrite transport system ATP-binding protein